jgi:hypothetical protein
MTSSFRLRLAFHVAVCLAAVLVSSRPLAVLAQSTDAGTSDVRNDVPDEEAPEPARGSVAPIAALPVVADGSATPVAPATVTRDEAGHVTVRAVRLLTPIRLDGALDEALYTDVLPISGFIQMEPHAGEPATERTDVWLSFDNDNVYISVKAWDTEMETLIATDMRRDSNAAWQGNDIFSFAFDTFHDKRNAIAFTVNPLGGRSDGQVVNERQYSGDWNPVWDLKTGRFDGGWTIEAALPFKSFRYQAGDAQVWGFNALRIKRAKNELSTLTRVNPARGQQAFRQPSFAATLVGIEAPKGGRNLDLKPYVTSSLTTDRTATPLRSNDPTSDVGLDLKYAVTQGLSADLTVNTDFAQVEADEQQVNLTRFSLFFPEKREFFLENAGTFSFGGVNAGNNNNNNDSAAPILFYSRRIGLNNGRVVPLEAGGRLTGRAGRYSIGALVSRTGEETAAASPPNTFGVVRIKRDVLRRSSIGLIATGRSVALGGQGRNAAYGIDGTFGFYDSLSINTYWAKTESDGRGSDDASYRAQLDYNGDRYGLQLEQLGIGKDFNPEVGFVRRGDLRRSRAQARFSPRPKNMPSVRRFRYQGNLVYAEDGAGILESREREAEFEIEFQNGDKFGVGYNNQLEFLPVPFAIVPSVSIPVGGYAFDTFRVAFELGRQRTVSSQMSFEYGTFYSGHRTQFTASQGRVSVTRALSVEPNYSLNKVDLVEGAFTTHLFGSRVTYTMTPMMFASALIQYNTGTNSVSTNARLRWEYRPGSEFFIVYTDERNTLTPGYPSLSNRSFVVKLNRLFRL